MMQNTTMLKLPLYLNGHYAGKTIKLADIQFTNGKVVLYGSAQEVQSLANYLGKCYQAWPEGQRLNPETGEIEYGASTVQEERLSDLEPKIREEERQAKEVPANVGTGTDESNMDERRGDSSRLGHEDPRLPSPEDGYDNPSTAKIDPEKLLGAMQRLNPEAKEHWRADGQPRIDAVAALYGSEGITRKDLQAVWPELTRDVKKQEDAKVNG
jgi:hypothetical protein